MNEIESINEDVAAVSVVHHATLLDHKRLVIYAKEKG